MPGSPWGGWCGIGSKSGPYDIVIRQVQVDIHPNPELGGGRPVCCALEAGVQRLVEKQTGKLQT
jgi:hypothetical protein